MPKRTCLATLPNVALVCGADTQGAFDVCPDCADRLHAIMRRTLDRYLVDEGFCAELDAHFRAYHASDTRGLVCPDCFDAGHRRNFGLPVGAHWADGTVQGARPTLVV